MSWQNFFLKNYLRLAVKTKLSSNISVEEGRRELDDAIRSFMPPLPSWVTISSSAADGVAGEWVDADKADRQRVILYFHGGGFTGGSPLSHRGITCALARGCVARLLVVEYRLAPEHPFPAAVEDALAAYRRLLEMGYDAGNLVLVGDQAGANLALATMMQARDAGEPLPAAAVILSPWVDLTLAGSSLNKNAPRDCVLTPFAMQRARQFYLEDSDPAQPLVSPLFGDLQGLPPTLIQASETEILWDDATRLLAALRAAGVAATLDAWPDVPHMWQLASFDGVVSLPEGRKAVKNIAAYLAKVWS